MSSRLLLLSRSSACRPPGGIQPVISAKKTAKPYGRAYRCGDPTCPPTVSASPRLVLLNQKILSNRELLLLYDNWYLDGCCRFKLNIIAGDETAETTFILFGRLAQRLIGRSVDTLLHENPSDKDYIPSAITDLLEKQFVWNVSITENTVATGVLSFQVNRIVGGVVNNTLALLQSPSGSQAYALGPTMALSPAASHDQSIAQSSAPATPSVDISDTNVGATSLRITGSQDQNIDLECASKTPAQTAEEDEYDQVSSLLPYLSEFTWPSHARFWTPVV